MTTTFLFSNYIILQFKNYNKSMSSLFLIILNIIINIILIFFVTSL